MLIGIVALWPFVAEHFSMSQSNPFGRVPASSVAVELLITSVCISALYIVHSYLALLVSRGLPRSRIIEFFARNTIFVFIAHMPILYAIGPTMAEIYANQYVLWFGDWATEARVFTNTVIYFVVLSVIGEVIRQAVKPDRLRHVVEQWISPVLVRFA